MIYQVHIPSTPLSQLITHFTYYKNYTPDHSIDRFLPDGNVEIIIDLTDTPKYIYDNDTLKEKQACNRLWISGIRNDFITIPSGKDSEMFVINFRKGMVYPFLGMPLHEITDTVVDGDLILNSVFSELRDRLLGAPAADMFATAEEQLMKKYSSSLTVNPFINYAVGQIVNAPDVAVIGHIADRTGYSSKHLIHLFENNVGVTPKAFLRIIRFQKAIAEIERKGSTNFAILASSCGYYDQSHFISDFKRFAGYTPAEYMKKKAGDYLNYVPVR